MILGMELIESRGQFWCHLCFRDNKQLVELESPHPHLACKIRICAPCLRKALKLIEEVNKDV